MKKLFILFSSFYFTVIGSIFCSYIGRQFSDYQNAMIYISLSAAVFLIVYLFTLFDIDDYDFGKMENAGEKLQNLMPLILLFGTVLYLIFTLYYHDYLLLFIPLYWMSKSFYAFDWVFFFLFNIIAIFIGSSFLINDRFVIKDYIHDLIYHDNHFSAKKVESESPYAGHGVMFLQTLRGFIFACLIVFTPIILVLTTIYDLRWLSVKIFYAKKPSPVKKTKFIHRFKGINIALSVFSCVSLIAGIGVTHGVYDLISTQKEFTINNENFADFFSVENFATPQDSGFSRSLSSSIQNGRLYRITNFTATIHGEYKQMRIDDPETYTIIPFEMTKSIQSFSEEGVMLSFLVVMDLTNTFYYEFLSAQYDVANGTATLIPQLSPGLYQHSFAGSSSNFSLSGYSIIFEKNCYVFHLRLVIQNELGNKGILTLNRIYAFAGDSFIFDDITNTSMNGPHTKIISVVSITKSFYL